MAPGQLRGPPLLLLVGQQIIRLGLQVQLHEHRVHDDLLGSAGGPLLPGRCLPSQGEAVLLSGARLSTRNTSAMLRLRIGPGLIAAVHETRAWMIGRPDAPHLLTCPLAEQPFRDARAAVTPSRARPAVT